MREEVISMMPQEKETTPQYKIECIAPHGLGFGEGPISAERQASPEQLAQAIDILLQHRDKIVVPVDEDDDGCGDGRPAGLVFQVIDGKTGEVRQYHKSKNRAKLLGGGLQVAASMWRAVAGKPLAGETVLGDREFIAAKLKERGIRHGAHTDSHAHGDTCGCGALDKYPQAVRLGEVYAAHITGAVAGLDNPPSERGLKEAFASRRDIATDEHYMSNASGRATMDLIESYGAVIKRLEGDHGEGIVFMNEEEGTTIDQQQVAEMFAEAGLPPIQVFVVDVWRGRMYADVVADIAAELGYDRSQANDVAMADFFANQLLVSAALTDGTQPVVYNRLAA